VNDLDSVLATLDQFGLLDSLQTLRVGNVSFSLNQKEDTKPQEVFTHPFQPQAEETEYDPDILFAAAHSK
jgi:hypothetical protein